MTRNAWRALSALILIGGLGWAYATRPQSSAAAPAAASTRIGAPAPDIALPMLSGESRTLADFRGQVVILNFWATWCGPCRAEMSALAEIQSQYACSAVIVIGVNQREDAGSVRRYLDSIGVDFPIALDPTGESNRQYRVLGLPTTYLVDRQGVIRDAVFGGPMARALIESSSPRFWSLMQPFIQIFGLAISAAPAAVWLGFVLAIWLAGRTAAWRGLDGRVLGDALTVAGFAALLGARLGYVALHASVYVRDPLAALALSTSALDGAFGALAGVGALAWRLRRAGMLRWAAADALAPPALVLGMGFALASYFDGAVFGAVAEVPWAVEVWGAARHPVQFYEIAGLLATLAMVIFLRGRALPAGALALGAVLAYGVLRLVVDGFRADEAALLAGLRITQLVAAFGAALAAWGLGEAARDYGGDATSGMSVS